MNGKMIVILMMSVLIVLFLLSRRFRRKEQGFNLLEAASFESVQKWVKDKSEANKKEALERIIAVSVAHGMKPEKAQAHAAQELEKFN